MLLGKKLMFVLTVFITLIISNVAVVGRSLYVITEHTPDGTFTAYDIQDYNIVYQTSTGIHHEQGPVGLALDEVSETLFVSYDGSAAIEITGFFNRKTGNSRVFLR
jgi:hypothetical protein